MEHIHPDQHPWQHPLSAANRRKWMHQSYLHIHCCAIAAVQGQRSGAGDLLAHDSPARVACDPRRVAAVTASTLRSFALARRFAEQGIKDGVQFNSVVPGAENSVGPLQKVKVALAAEKPVGRINSAVTRRRSVDEGRECTVRL